MIPNYFEAIEDKKYQSMCWFNYETLCFKELKKNSLGCVFDENPKTGLRQW